MAFLQNITRLIYSELFTVEKPCEKFCLQGAQDALSCRSLSTKEPPIIGLFCGKCPVETRHLTCLGHPVRDAAARSLALRVAVCGSVLQCVAVCCSVLQCVAVCCSVLRCVAVCCGVLHTAQHTPYTQKFSQGCSTFTKYGTLRSETTFQNLYLCDTAACSLATCVKVHIL